MALPISTEDPIVVVVRDGSWHAYSLHDSITERDEELFALLQSMGGIKNTVESGAYHFNAVELAQNSTVVQLEPIKNLRCSRIFHGL